MPPQMNRIGMITTLETNIGDDFIREGISLVLNRALKGKTLGFIPVNKHQPYTVYAPQHPVRLVQSIANRLPRGQGLLSGCAARLFHRIGFSRFDPCDLIVQCGTPVAWPGCSRCEWAEPLWHQVVGRLSRKGVPVLNLGAGACYPWEDQSRQVTQEEDAAYLRRILGYCRITTVRDTLAQRLFESLGYPSPLIPCPALLAGEPSAQHASEDLVVINYMKGGGHYDWGQVIDAERWRDVVGTVFARLSRRFRLLFLCHDRKEFDLAGALAPTVPRILPANSQEYFAAVARAKVAICNRLHAAVALAGIGVPSVAIGTDTRLLMVETIGLPCLYVKDATVERVEASLESLLANWTAERDRLLALRQWTLEQYTSLITKALEGTSG